MNKICCTIVSPSHLYKGITTLFSVKEYDNEIILYLIVTDPIKIELENITILSLDVLCKNDPQATTIADIYRDRKDAFRWSLKPIVLRHLISENSGATVIYCDCDMCFFASPTHLYDYCKMGGIVLTPHWLTMDPDENITHFRESFRSGLFNAGCVVANEKGLYALDYWVKACISGCEVDFSKGLFVDQKYLDLMLIYFPETIVCRHTGYNLAAWNIEMRNRFLVENEGATGSYEVALIHFTFDTMLQILLGKDIILQPHFVKYRKKLNSAVNLLIDSGVSHPQSIDRILYNTW